MRGTPTGEDDHHFFQERPELQDQRFKKLGLSYTSQFWAFVIYKMSYIRNVDRSMWKKVDEKGG